MPILNKYHGNIPSDAVYIGRGSKWGNPFVIGKDGSRDVVIAKYEVWLQQRLIDGVITLEELSELYGKSLVCFCTPQRCHGEVLEYWAEVAARYLGQIP